MDTKVKDLVTSAIGNIHDLSDTDTIIGDAIKAGDNITIIPVSKVSYGFAAGGSDLPSKNEKELFGGGSGAGVSIQPIAFIVINGSDVRLLELGSGKSPANAIVNAVPDLISKIQAMFPKKNKEEGTADDIPSAVTPDIEKVDINTDGLST